MLQFNNKQSATINHNIYIYIYIYIYKYKNAIPCENSFNSNIIIPAAGFQSAVVFSSSIFEINFKFLQQQFEILRVCAKTKRLRLQNISFAAGLNWIRLPLTILSIK